MRVQNPGQEDPAAGKVRGVLVGGGHGVKRGETLSNVSNIKSNFPVKVFLFTFGAGNSGMTFLTN